MKRRTRLWRAQYLKRCMNKLTVFAVRGDDSGLAQRSVVDVYDDDDDDCDGYSDDDAFA